MCMGTPSVRWVWRSENSLWDSVLFFHYGVSEYQVVGLGGKHLFPLSQTTASPLAVLPLFLLAGAALALPSSGLTELKQRLSNLFFRLLISLFRLIHIPYSSESIFQRHSCNPSIVVRDEEVIGARGLDSGLVRHPVSEE